MQSQDAFEQNQDSKSDNKGNILCRAHYEPCKRMSMKIRVSLTAILGYVLHFSIVHKLPPFLGKVGESEFQGYKYGECYYNHCEYLSTESSESALNNS